MYKRAGGQSTEVASFSDKRESDALIKKRHSASNESSIIAWNPLFVRYISFNAHMHIILIA